MSVAPARGIAAVLLAGMALGPGDPAPFEMELPPGYSKFVPGEQPETWKAAAAAAEAQFVVGHLRLENAGAIPAKVENWRRDAW